MGSAVRCVLLLAAVLAISNIAGCSWFSGTEQAVKDQQQNKDLQQKLDELKRQQEQEKLQQQIDELKEEQAEQKEQEKQNQEPPVVVVGSSAPEGQVVVSPRATYSGTDQESAALKAAIAYYEAAERGDYAYTYNALHPLYREKYSYSEWVYANQQLDSAAAEFVIFSVEEAPGPADHVRVGLTVHLPDGTSFNRYTNFLYERGAWKHSLTREEFELFDSVL